MDPIGPPYVIDATLDSPLVATAIHAGHGLRPEIEALMQLDDRVRLREEDPYTDRWTSIARNRVCVRRSRFEVDLNREAKESVCAVPEDCWDLDVWRSEIPPEVCERTLAIHAHFYDDLRGLLGRIAQRFGCFVLYDLHSYNHRRGDRPEPQRTNPDINLGTGALERERWGRVVDAFTRAIDGYDVRENVKFRGGYLSQWVHETFPQTGCALAIDVKKFFMDEHTGELDAPAHEAVGRALQASVPAVLGELRAVA